MPETEISAANTTPQTGNDRAAIDQQVQETLLQLLSELGASRADAAVNASAHLESDLGLGSLERAELMARLDTAFGIALPEEVVAHADTVADLTAAVEQALAAEPAIADDARASGAQRRAACATPRGAGGPPIDSRLPRDTRSLPRRILEGAYGLYALSVFGILLVLTWLIILATPGRHAVTRITCWAAWLCLFLAGCRIRVAGREHLARGEPFVFVSNHTSLLDILVLLASLPHDYRFVAKLEVTAMPFIRLFIRKMDHFVFDRTDRRARLRQVEEIEETLRRGESVFVFAEGTLTPQGGVRPFQLGAFKAAVDTGRPILPVALRGVREMLRDETVLPHPPRGVRLTVLPPLLPARITSASTWQEMMRLRDAARAAIAQHSGEPLL